MNRGLERTRKRWTLTAAVLAVMLAFGAFPASTAAAPDEIEDGDITQAVDVEMMIDRQVPSQRLDIRTDEGVVTLTGTVDNILAKERAVRLARSVRGVRAVVDRIDVVALERPDEELRQDVHDALLMDPATDAFEIDVSASDGHVTLEGTVESWTEKMLCESVAKGVQGVRSCDNEIEIRYPMERVDGEIEKEIERRLERDIWVDAAPIDVEVEDGAVQLTGIVGSATEKSRVRRDAWVAGVGSVDASEIEIRSWARSEMERSGPVIHETDRAIEEAIRDAFLYDPRVFSFRPTVTVRDGEVTLTGEVDNLRAKKAAEEDARNVPGVWRVRNHLRVRPVEVVPDEKLERRIQSAFVRDPYVDRFEITVDALHGAVYLRGTVDYPYERTRAETLASTLNGVVEVHNLIDVRDAEPVVKDDWEIEADIEDQIFWSPFVDSDEIVVDVEGGIATLTGTVDSFQERRMAVENAYQGGALSVINKIRIRSVEPTDTGS